MSNDRVEYFKIKLADKNIEIECNYRKVFSQCRDYLTDFEEADFVVNVSLEEILSECKRFPKIQKHDPNIAVRYGYEFIESNLIYKRIAESMIGFNTLLMHGSVISYENQGYMFVAPSGTGKTTRTRIWMDMYPGTIIINGDKPLVKVNDNEVIAYGTPWCGKEGWNTNSMISLDTIFFLERANDDMENSIEEIGFREAFPLLIQHTFHSIKPDNMRNTIRILKVFEKKVKFYRFRSTPTKEAIQLAYLTSCKKA